MKDAFDGVFSWTNSIWFKFSGAISVPWRLARVEELVLTTRSLGENQINPVDSAGFRHWTVEVDGYTLREGCSFDPDSEQTRWKQADANDPFAQAYCFAYPQVDQSHVIPGIAAIARRKRQGSENDYYAFLICAPGHTASPQRWFSRHYQVERVMDQMLDCLNLNRMISLENKATAAYFAIASLAHNLLTALRWLLKPDASHWKISDTIRGIIMTPAVLSRTSRENKLYLAAQSSWPKPWIEFVSQSMPNFRPKTK